MSKSRAAIERAQEANGKKSAKSYGVYYVAEHRLMDDGEMPTRDEWLKEQEAKRNNAQERPPGRSEPQILQGKK